MSDRIIYVRIKAGCDLASWYYRWVGLVFPVYRTTDSYKVVGSHRTIRLGDAKKVNIEVKE